MNETAMPAARANARRAEQLLQVRRARDRHRAGARRTLSLAMWHNGKWRCELRAQDLCELRGRIAGDLFFAVRAPSSA